MGRMQGDRKDKIPAENAAESEISIILGSLAWTSHSIIHINDAMNTGSIHHALGQAVLGVALAAALLLILPVRAALAEGWEMLMVEQPGCVYCRIWHAEIGPIYPLSPEGRFAPLRVVRKGDLPDDVTLSKRVAYTPTFVLLSGGQEIARIEGYPGDDLFWSMLGPMLNRAHPDWAVVAADAKTGGGS